MPSEKSKSARLLQGRESFNELKHHQQSYLGHGVNVCISVKCNHVEFDVRIICAKASPPAVRVALGEGGNGSIANYIDVADVGDALCSMLADHLNVFTAACLLAGCP